MNVVDTCDLRVVIWLHERIVARERDSEKSKVILGEPVSRVNDIKPNLFEILDILNDTLCVQNEQD